jgi:tetratricopeptide (TPR) repeat protein
MSTPSAERDFLLRSPDDLEAERAAGNIDDGHYRALHDDYTARAAAVLRSMEAGVDVRPVAARPPVRRRVLVAAALVGFAMVAAALMVAGLSDRSPGGSLTGNQQIGGSGGEGRTSTTGSQNRPDGTTAAEAEAAENAARVEARRREAEQNPNDAAAQERLADAYIAAGNVAEAVRAFDTAGRLDPKNARALAYGGWYVFLAARASEDPNSAVVKDLLEGAIRRLDAAVTADPEFPDAHFFRGMVLLRGLDNPAAAVPEFERYITQVPDGPQTPQVKNLLEAARAEAAKK